MELNREDTYQNTALDYLLYSPNFEMQMLLIEPGFDWCTTITSTARNPASAKADLAPGLTLSVRLDNPVYSDLSRTGDPVHANVTYTLCKDSEQIACKDGEIPVAPGTDIKGTVLFARKATE